MDICIVYYYKNDEIRHSSITSLVRGGGKNGKSHLQIVF